MSKLSQITDDEQMESLSPFQHHSGHLEYSGFTPSEEPAASPTPSNLNTATKPKQQRKSSAQVVVPLTDEDKRKLEADLAAKSMEALWRCNQNWRLKVLNEKSVIVCLMICPANVMFDDVDV